MSVLPPRRRVHALLVAVDHYPYCGAATPLHGDLGAFTRSLGPLSCAAASADTMARWLVDRLTDDPYTPLDSLELAVSAAPGPRAQAVQAWREVRVGGVPVRVGPATWEGTSRAFDAWYERCDRSGDSIALLGFWGHGVRLGVDDLLLLEDFGASVHRPFDGAVDFARTYRGMRACRALDQCFFIDACRSVPEQLLGMTDLRGRALRSPDAEIPPRNAPILQSTAVGSAAYGTADRPTRFTEALLRTLDGTASVQQRGGRWVVTTDDLGRGVRAMTRWAPAGTGRDHDGRDQQVAVGGECGDAVLRVLPHAPRVPFRIGCSPSAALPAAHLRAAGRDWNGTSRPPRVEPWSGVAPIDRYQVSACFPDGRYADSEAVMWLIPPTEPFDVPVAEP